MTTTPDESDETRPIRDWMLATRHTRLGLATAVGPVSYTHLTLPTNREV